MNYKWGDACKEAGLNTLPEVPQQTLVVFAYKDGEVKQFDTIKEAQKFSSNMERKWVSTTERDEIINQRNEAIEEAFKIWYAHLRNYWEQLSDEMFAACYEEAYRRGHSYGHDEVANYMYDVVDFAKLIKSVVEKDRANERH